MSPQNIEELFPRSSIYDLNWIKENSLLHNTLYYTESLCNALKIKEGMNVLDLGCGKAISSIFIAKEYNVKVWAVDKESSPTENYQRILLMNCEDKVFPVKGDARQLPFPHKYFDIIVSIDSFSYYGTDDWYIPYISQFLKPNGLLAISEWCFSKEFNTVSEIPDYLKKCYRDSGFYGLHSIEWWRHHLTKSGLFKITNAEILPENKYLLEDFINEFKDLKSEKEIVKALQNDKLNIINTFRIIGERTNLDPYFDDFADINPE
jgi:ubiquinone/menaquinone biosynthesis C-methylase UbiE